MSYMVWAAFLAVWIPYRIEYGPIALAKKRRNRVIRDAIDKATGS